MGAYDEGMANRVIALARSSHPGPTIVVTIVATVLGVAVSYSWWRLIVLGLVVLCGQLSIGFSNDWLDAGRDAAVNRRDKPTALGQISPAVVRRAAFVAAAASVALSLLLGPAAAIANLICFGMGWAYNLGLKSTLASIVPYLVCFGLLPAVATLGLVPPRMPAAWVLAAGALLGAAAHLTNVLPDLEDDRSTGIRGLPHVMGARASGIAAFVCLAVAGGLVAFSEGSLLNPLLVIGFALGLAMAVTGIVLTLARRPTRLLMRLIMAGAIVDVVMLALTGTSMLA